MPGVKIQEFHKSTILCDIVDGINSKYNYFAIVKYNDRYIQSNLKCCVSFCKILSLYHMKEAVPTWLPSETKWLPREKVFEAITYNLPAFRFVTRRQGKLVKKLRANLIPFVLACFYAYFI